MACDCGHCPGPKKAAFLAALIVGVVVGGAVVLGWLLSR